MKRRLSALTLSLTFTACSGPDSDLPEGLPRVPVPEARLRSPEARARGRALFAAELRPVPRRARRRPRNAERGFREGPGELHRPRLATPRDAASRLLRDPGGRARHADAELEAG